MVKELRKRVISFIMTLAMLVSLMPALTLPAKAAVWDGTANTSWYNAAESSFNTKFTLAA